MTSALLQSVRSGVTGGGGDGLADGGGGDASWSQTHFQMLVGWQRFEVAPAP